MTSLLHTRSFNFRFLGLLLYTTPICASLVVCLCFCLCSHSVCTIVSSQTSRSTSQAHVDFVLHFRCFLGSVRFPPPLDFSTPGEFYTHSYCSTPFLPSLNHRGGLHESTILSTSTITFFLFCFSHIPLYYPLFSVYNFLSYSYLFPMSKSSLYSGNFSIPGTIWISYRHSPHALDWKSKL